MNPPLRIVAHGICCAVGHTAPAACAAIRARMNHFRETGFIDESGQPLKGASLYGVDVWGESRLQAMFHSVLAECTAQLSSADANSGTAILLLCGERARSGPHLAWADHMLDGTVAEGGYHDASDVLPLGKAGIVEALREAQRLFQTKNAPRRVIVAGVESYLDGQTVEAMLGDERLATTLNSDGFIPGEAAAAIVVSRDLGDAGQPGLWIEGMGQAQETATVCGNTPLRATGLTSAMRAAALEAHCRLADLDFHASGVSGESWYSREAALALARGLETRVAEFPHHAVSRFVGEVGAACPPLTLAWLARAMARDDGPGRRALAHFSNDDGRRAALVLRYSD